jgi:hypothetical protein
MQNEYEPRIKWPVQFRKPAVSGDLFVPLDDEVKLPAINNREVPCVLGGGYTAAG